MAKELNATAIYIEKITSHLMVLRVKPDEPEFSFISGQYMIIGLPYMDGERQRWIQRAYSIASNDREKGYIEFYITLVDEGALTPKLFALNEGDRVFINTKAMGHLTTDSVPKEKHIITISTGTGLAPFVSLVRSKLDLISKNKHIVIVHGTRYSETLGYREELLELCKKYSNLHYIPVLSRGSEDDKKSGCEIGYVQNVIKNNVIKDRFGIDMNKDNSEVFVCGNTNMAEEIKTLFMEKGYIGNSAVPEENTVHLEGYY